MEKYHNIFKNKYLIGDKIDSPISIKGIEKLANYFKSIYNYIDIIIIKEKDITNEFKKFYDILKKFNDNNNITINKGNPIILDSNEEDELFDEIKSFNLKYGSIKDENIIFKEILAKYNIFSKILYADGEIIKNLVCKKILREEKKSKINYFIWYDDHHYSLVAHIENYYFFLDSCSTFFKRWPTKTIISDDKKNKLFLPYKTIVMKSFLQNDDFSCGTYVYAFIDLLCNLYEAFNRNYEKFFAYLFRYFNNFSEESYITEYNSVFYYNKIEEELVYSGNVNLFMLPKEFLYLSQSIKRLKFLRDSIKAKVNNNFDDEKTIDEIIDKLKKKKVIEEIREFHMVILNSE